MTEGMGEDERVLVERLKGRDRTAMAVLYDRFGRVVYSLILAMVRNEALAQDLSQESFLRIWTNIQAFDPGRGALGPWICTVARNRALDHVRSSSHRMAMASQDTEVLARVVQQGAEMDPALTMGRAEAVRAAFGKLPEQQREVLGLAYFEGLSQTEIADKLNKPLGTVKTWTRTAMTFLRKELELWSDR